MGNGPSYSVPALEKAIAILKYLKKKQTRYATVTQIARDLDLNKGTCYAVLQTLREHDLVTYDEATKQYSLGWLLPELAGAVMDETGWVKITRARLKVLIEGTHFTGCIWKRISFRRVILLERVDRENQARITLPLGARLPIPTGSMGQCFMAYMPEAEREELLATELHQFTSSSVCDPEIYRQRTREVRERGFAEDYEGYERGITAVSAPVFDSDGEVMTVASLVAMSSVYAPEVMRSYGHKLAQCCREITATIGGKMPCEI